MRVAASVEAIEAVTNTLASTADWMATVQLQQQAAPILELSSAVASDAFDAASAAAAAMTTMPQLPSQGGAGAGAGAGAGGASVIADVAVDAWSVSGGTTLGARFAGVESKLFQAGLLPYLVYLWFLSRTAAAAPAGRPRRTRLTHELERRTVSNS